MADGDEVEVCGAWTDSTQPAWSQGGKVTCERPFQGQSGHRGAHSARATAPGAGAPVTLSWMHDARPPEDQPAPEPRPPADVDEPLEHGARQHDGSFRDALVRGLASGQIEARVLGHDEDGTFVVDEVVELIGIKFGRS